MVYHIICRRCTILPVNFFRRATTITAGPAQPDLRVEKAIVTSFTAPITSAISGCPVIPADKPQLKQLQLIRNWCLGLTLTITLGLILLLSVGFVSGWLDVEVTLLLVASVIGAMTVGLGGFHLWLFRQRRKYQQI